MALFLNGQSDIIRTTPGQPDVVVATIGKNSLTSSEVTELEALPVQSMLKQAYLRSTAKTELQGYEVESVQTLVSGAGNVLTKRGNRGMRIFGGRTATAFSDGGTAKTHHCVVSTARHFDAVQVVLSACNSGTAVPLTSCAVSPLATAADLNGSSGTWTAATFSGSAGGSIPARSGSSRRTYLVSDIIPVSSVNRSDGGAYPLLAIRAYLGTTGTYTLFGASGGADDFTNWATKSDGRIHVMRYNDGDCITTPASFASTTNRNTSPIIGIIYYARGRVVNVVGFGDSITEGRSTYLGEGWGFPACAQASNANVAYEWSNLGWAGASWENGAASPGGIRLMISDAIVAALPIDVGVMPCWSPNDFADEASLSDANMRTECQQPVARAIGLLRDYGAVPVLWTGLPGQVVARDYNSADVRRRYWNATMMASGLACVDFSAVLSGSMDADGQVLPADGVFVDTLHPNDYGNGLLAAPMARMIASIV